MAVRKTTTVTEGEAKRPRGRPPQPEEVRRRNNLTLRIRDETKGALEKAASGNGRSLSEEAELRLDHSLRSGAELDQILDLAFGRQVAGFLLLLGRVMSETGSAAGFATAYTLEGATSWLGNRYAYDQAAHGVEAVFDALRPSDLKKTPALLTLERLGVGFATTALSAVAGEPFGEELTQWAEQVRARLGQDAVALIKDALAPPPGDP